MPGDVVVVKLSADGANVSDETIQARAQAAGARQAALCAVRRLHGRPGAFRSRQVAVDGRVRQQGDRAARAGVVPDRADGELHRRADRHSARHHIRALPRYLDRPQRAGAGGLGAGHPLVLARHADHPDAADAVQLAAEDRLRVDLGGPDRQPVGDDLAGALGRLPLCGGGHPHDALGAAGGDARGLHPHRARQGRVDAADHAPACPAQCAAAGGDGDRAGVRVPDRRPGGDRAGVQHQRHRQAVRGCDDARRLQSDPGPRAVHRHHVHLRQPDRRPALCVARSAHPTELRGARHGHRRHHRHQPRRCPSGPIRSGSSSRCSRSACSAS